MAVATLSTTDGRPDERKGPRATHRAPHGSPVVTGGSRFTGMQRRPSIGWRLRQLREEANLTQDELYELTKGLDPDGRGVQTYTITRQENNKHVPKPRSVELLAQALSQRLGRKITPAYLMGGGRAGLASYLERERKRRAISDTDAFASLIGLSDGKRYRHVLEEGDWTSEELGRLLVIMPEAGPPVMDMLATRAAHQPLPELAAAG